LEASYWLMTNLDILYTGAAVLALSDVLALATIAIWALNERRLDNAPRFRVVGHAGANDDAPMRAQVDLARASNR